MQTSLEEKPCVVLHSVEGLSRSGNSQNKRVLRDLHQLRACLESALGRTDRLRFLLGYLDLPRLTLEARQLVEKLLGRSKKRRPNTVGSP